MIHKAKDLSPEQKVAIESLLGRQVLDDEAISVRAIDRGNGSRNHFHPRRGYLFKDRETGPGTLPAQNAGRW